MATDRAGWSITRKVSENIEYTHKWAIERFDFAMGANMGRIKSGRFCIPGVPGEFHMVVKEQTERCYDTRSSLSDSKAPKGVKVNDQEFDVKFYFSVSLKSTVEGSWQA